MKTVEITAEEAELIYRGERPENMDFNLYKYYRALANRFRKERLKGELVHESVHYIELGKDKFKRVGNTYIKPKEDA